MSQHTRVRMHKWVDDIAANKISGTFIIHVKDGGFMEVLDNLNRKNTIWVKVGEKQQAQ